LTATLGDDIFPCDLALLRIISLQSLRTKMKVEGGARNFLLGQNQREPVFWVPCLTSLFDKSTSHGWRRSKIRGGSQFAVHDSDWAHSKPTLSQNLVLRNLHWVVPLSESQIAQTTRYSDVTFHRVQNPGVMYLASWTAHRHMQKKWR
jgi:hypothetical protein